MPFYEYQCSACGAQTEVLQKITDAPLRKCPECGKNQLKKLVSAPIFRLKGGGWYETDFKTDKDNKRNLVDSDGDSKASKSETTSPKAGDASAKAEAPAPKAEAKAEAKPKAKSVAKPAARPAAKAAKKPAAKARARR